ncbi:hypothetical protein HOY82DRAFT_543049 [Tuber indicum]|nr:hypothetical protein HOY82DRAFT_543049 [Tuber indicum]
MSDNCSGEEKGARGERPGDSNSPGNSTGGMVSRWLDAVNVSTATTATQFSRAGTPREVVRRTQVSESVFQTFSQEVRDLFSISTSPITRRPPQPHPHLAALTFHFDPPSAFDSYDTTPNTSALSSPSQPIRSSSGPSQGPASAQESIGQYSWRDSRVQSEGRDSALSVLEQRFTRYSSAPGRIATGSFRPVFTAGTGTQRTLGDIAPEETDAIRSFWAEIGTEARSGSDDEYAYVAMPGGAGVGYVDLEDGEEEYLNELANELICRFEYPGITQTSFAAPAWSDVSSSTSSGSSLSSGGLLGWGIATPPSPFLDGETSSAGVEGSSAEGMEGGGGDAGSMQENPLHPLNQVTNLSAPSTLPPTWVDTDTLAPFVFPPSPTREVPSISAFSPLRHPPSPTFTPEIYPFHDSPPPQSQELENWIAQNLAEYSHLSSTSTSASTLPYANPPASPNARQNPTAADTTTCPICYENPVTRGFPCSIQGAQHGLCGACFVEYEAYCTDVVRCPLCRHEFFWSQVAVFGSGVVGEDGGVGLVGGDEGFEVGSEVGGEHEVDEEYIEFYIGGYVL